MAQAQLQTAVAPLIPLDAGGTAFEGFIAPSPALRQQRCPPASLWLRVSGLAPGAPTLRGAALEVNEELAALLGEGEEGAARRGALARRLAESPSLPAFLLELQNVVDQAAMQRLGDGAAASRPAAFYSSLKAQLDAVGWRHVSALSEDLARLTLHAADAAGRRHELRLALPPGFPAAPPSAAADLPAAFELRWTPGASLAGALAQFQAALAQHQAAWDSLDDLDAHAWVIEPTAPARSVLSRRIALGNHVSLALTLDPLRPGALPPDLKFLGSHQAVAPLRQRLHDNRLRWQEGRLLRHNLEAVLELQLPRRQGVDAEDVSADCAICYAYRLPPPEGEAEGEAPDINCDNAACGKPFHRQCLVEWLNSDTSTRQSFNTLFGACPYCSAPITVVVS